jgi:hypothetical protein
VVYFEAGKAMKVSYNPRLVGLGREVRMLTMLGFAIPHKIQETTDLAKKFASQAKSLDQVPHTLLTKMAIIFHTALSFPDCQLSQHDRRPHDHLAASHDA